jgi:hypothetical protein
VSVKDDIFLTDTCHPPPVTRLNTVRLPPILNGQKPGHCLETKRRKFSRLWDSV